MSAPVSRWRSIVESQSRRPLRKLPQATPPAPADLSIRLMETAAVCMMSLLTHALMGFLLVMFYLEIQREPEPAYSVTIWRDARGKDVLKIGAPEEGPPSKGVDVAPEPPKKEEPPNAAPLEPKPDSVPPPPPSPAVEPAVKAPEPVAPPPKVEPEGGVKDPLPPAVALGPGASAGAPRSDTPGTAKAALGPESDVTDAEIDKDPSAAIRRRRSGTLVQLREGSQRDIVVVTGAYDHIQEVLDRLEIPYSMIDPEQLARYDFSNCKALLVNCHNSYSTGLFRLADTGTIEKEIDALEEKEIALRKRVQESKEKKKVFELGLELLKTTSQLSALRQQLASVTGAVAMVENVRKFVASGGYMFTSDWGISILERAFPGTVKNGGNIGPRTVTLRQHSSSKSPLLDDVFYTGPKSSTVTSRKMLWEVDSGSYMIKVEKPSVEVLAEAGDMAKSPAVAVTFTPDKSTGRVLHILSHFERQATKQGDYALQNLLLNFLMERIKK
jgi:hypothetical protein